MREEATFPILIDLTNLTREPRNLSVPGFFFAGFRQPGTTPFFGFRATEYIRNKATSCRCWTQRTAKPQDRGLLFRGFTLAALNAK